MVFIAAPPPGHKTCTKCGQCEKHSKNKSKRDGLQGHCVQCNKANKVANKDKIRAQKKQHYEEHRDERIAHQVEYIRNRYQTDEAFRLLTNCRTRLHHALKGELKAAKTVELQGVRPMSSSSTSNARCHPKCAHFGTRASKSSSIT